MRWGGAAPRTASGQELVSTAESCLSHMRRARVESEPDSLERHCGHIRLTPRRTGSRASAGLSTLLTATATIVSWYSMRRASTCASGAPRAPAPVSSACTVVAIPTASTLAETASYTRAIARTPGSTSPIGWGSRSSPWRSIRPTSSPRCGARRTSTSRAISSRRTCSSWISVAGRCESSTGRAVEKWAPLVALVRWRANSQFRAHDCRRLPRQRVRRGDCDRQADTEVHQDELTPRDRHSSTFSIERD